MDKEAIEKICELQAEIDGYHRFVIDFLVSILNREHRRFVVHDETRDASTIEVIWKSYDDIIKELADGKEAEK